jgi:hypothetical protein
MKVNPFYTKNLEEGAGHRRLPRQQPVLGR